MHAPVTARMNQRVVLLSWILPSSSTLSHAVSNHALQNDIVMTCPVALQSVLPFTSCKIQNMKFCVCWSCLHAEPPTGSLLGANSAWLPVWL
jgi:hypothetical protein